MDQNKAKYLGITMDEKLGYREHIDIAIKNMQ